MKRGRREAEAIALAMVAAVPLYFTAAIDIPAVGLFHIVMGLILGVEILRPDFDTPRPLLRLAAIGYFFFYFVDSAVFSRSLIRGTAHLLFFIAIYQSIDREAGKREQQRLLVTFLIAIASIATATHITITVFVVVFAMLMFRQLAGISREETLRLVGRVDDGRPPGRITAVYVVPMILIAALLFPFLPRVRDPFVRGFANALQTSTGFTDTIDMSDARSITTDPRVVARVKMPQEYLAFFTPLRLKGGHYDRYVNDKWNAAETTKNVMRYVRRQEDSFIIAEPTSFTGTVNIQQTRNVRDDQRLFLPVGTYKVDGLSRVAEGHNVGSYFVPGPGGPVLSYDVEMSARVNAFRPQRALPRYEVSNAIRQLADQITVNARTPRQNAVLIERYLATQYSYLANAERRAPLNAEKFLLEEKQGHCEHFAAGMVLLLSSRGIPARIAGGYYGGELNPLTGYFIVRQRDAHAWVEVWENETWVTYDPTPPDLRPGSAVPNFIVAYLTAIGDSINFFWDRYILTFGIADQINIVLNAFWSFRDALDAIRNGIKATPSVGRLLAYLGGLLLAGLIVALIFIRPRLRRSLFERLAARLRRVGIVVRPEMTTAEILHEVERTKPQYLTPTRTIVECYRRDRFSPSGASEELLTAARSALQRIGEAKA